MPTDDLPPDLDSALIKDLLTPAQAASYTGLSHRTIRRYIHDGRLRASRLGPRRMWLSKDDLDAMLAAIPTIRPGR